MVRVFCVPNRTQAVYFFRLEKSGGLKSKTLAIFFDSLSPHLKITKLSTFPITDERTLGVISSKSWWAKVNPT